MHTWGVTTPPASTSLSVRAEAQRTIAPDAALVHTNLRFTADTKAAAIAEIQAVLPIVLEDLTRLGGVVLTSDTMRAALTWSTQSIRTHEEHGHIIQTGEHGPTGRHQASASLLITVRDFALLAGVSRAVTSNDVVEVAAVTWSVDDDNTEWGLVRADAIGAALRKGRDYAAALGGTVTSVDHVADAGLLGGGDPIRLGRASALQMGAASGGGGGNDLSLDPVPQILSATIEARFTASVGVMPTS